MRTFFFALALTIAVGLVACGSDPTGTIVADMGGDAAADATADAAPDSAPAPEAAPTPLDASTPDTAIVIDATPLPVADTGPDTADAAPVLPGSCSSAGSCGARATCVNAACIAGNRLFVTSTTYTAILGAGLVADTDCQTVATNAGLGGTWKAWVSGSLPGDEAPATDFTRGSNYQLVDGTVVSPTGTFNPPLHAIDEDETGAKVAAAHVWTNTNPAGTSLPTACNDMNSADPTQKAGYGRTDLTGAVNAYPSWSYAGVDTCDTKNRLYCFEQ